VGTDNLEARYASALTFAEMVDGADTNVALWRALHAHARVPAEILARVAALGGRWRLLVLSEAWCGDSLSTVPLMARLAELAPNVELRLLARDQSLDLMDTHLTNGSRSIPYAIVLDEGYVERGGWGPRPRALQQWVIAEGLALPKEERYAKVRQWYARDRGVTTLDELVTVLEHAAASAVPPASPFPARLPPRATPSPVSDVVAAP
jgi:hypothetical protein